MKKIAVIAGSRQEFDLFCENNQNKDNVEYVYVTSIKTTYGVHFDELILTGTYKHRKDWMVLKDRIELSNYRITVTVNSYGS